MHCLRWWLPLLLLPLPAARPAAALLFAVCYALGSRPCAYCLIMLTLLLVSTCAWYAPSLAALAPPREPEQVLDYSPAPSPFSALLGPSAACAAPSPRAPSACWLCLSSLVAAPMRPMARAAVPALGSGSGLGAHAGAARPWLRRLLRKREWWLGLGARSRGIGYRLQFGWDP